MIFENVLDEYKEKVEKEAPKRQQTRLEDIMNFLLIEVGVVLSVGTIYFNYTNNAAGEFILIGICIVVAFVTIAVNQHQFWKVREERKQLYHERLVKLMEMLRENHWDSEEKMAFLIERCDEYSKTDSAWVKEMKPFGKMISTFIIPVLIFMFKEIYSEYQEQKIEILVSAFLFVFIGGVVVCIISPAVRDLLNRREKLAERMKHDLKQLQLEQKLKA